MMMDDDDDGDDDDDDDESNIRSNDYTIYMTRNTERTECQNARAQGACARPRTYSFLFLTWCMMFSTRTMVVPLAASGMCGRRRI